MSDTNAPQQPDAPGSQPRLSSQPPAPSQPPAASSQSPVPARAAGTEPSGNGAASLPGTQETTQRSRAHSVRSRVARVSPVALVLAALVLAAGVAASIIGAGALAHDNAASARSSFRAENADVTSKLNLAIQHEEDLVISASTFFAANPGASRGEFAAWVHWAQPLRRYSELDKLALIALVPVMETVTEVPGRASSPLAGAKAPAGGLIGTRPAPVLSSPRTSALAFGARVRTVASKTRFHCFAIAGLSRTGGYPPRGVDLCAHTPGLGHARDTGISSYARASAGSLQTLRIDTPVYRGSVPPPTVLSRRAAFVGWLREVLRPGLIMQQALAGHGEGALRLRHGPSAAKVVFASAAPVAGAQSTTVPLRNGWSARVYGGAVPGGVLSGGEPLELLIGGIAASLLLAGLLLALGLRRPAATVGSGDEDVDENLYDPLTGLPNRLLTLDRAERMLARARRQSGLLVGALFIDIDWLTDVNEKLGENAGDQLIKAVAERLTGTMRAQDTVGRLGGDEFVMLIETAGGARVDRIARRVIEALHKPVGFEDFGPSFYLSASIGVAMGRYTSTDELLHDAQLALEASKSAGKDRYTIFNANMRSVIEGRGLLEADLNNALHQRQFFLHYQPEYDVHTGRLVSFEALLRWLHPKRGVLAPADFLDLAEECGLMIPIGRWVLEEACNQAAAWGVAGHRVGASVNVSASQLHRDGFSTDVLRALQQSGLDPSLLTVEIPESTVMADVAMAAARIGEVKRFGVRVAIDDFGSGYAYRSELQRLSLDALKVDRGSLAESEDDDYRNWLLEAILILGRELSLSVVAKHVESAEQLAGLRDMGCTIAQGFFLARPGPAGALESLFDAPPAWEWLAQQRD